MTHAEVVIYEYNFWIQRYQFDTTAVIENGTPRTTMIYVTEKLRESTVDQLHRIANFAYAGGEGDLAYRINCAAVALYDDGTPPKPM